MKKKTSIIMTLVLMLSIVQAPLLTKAHSGTEDMNQRNYISENTENEEGKDTKDIVDIAISDGRFTTLVSALQAAGLVDTLKGNGPFTVFAPTDDAFSKLPAGTLDELLKPENKEALAKILTTHVVESKIVAADAKRLDGKGIKTVSGEKVKIEVKDGSVYINGAKVIVADIMAKNGVIHVIDTVIVPSNN